MPKKKPKRTKTGELVESGMKDGSTEQTYAKGEWEHMCGPRCEHNNGIWRFKDPVDGSLNGFVHSSQLQKDIWLGDMRAKGLEAAALGALRWFCFECGTLQEP